MGKVWHTVDGKTRFDSVAVMQRCMVRGPEYTTSFIARVTRAQQMIGV
jgi:hypothetical protein